MDCILRRWNFRARSHGRTNGGPLRRVGSGWDWKILGGFTRILKYISPRFLGTKVSAVAGASSEAGSGIRVGSRRWNVCETRRQLLPRLEVGTRMAAGVKVAIVVASAVFHLSVCFGWRALQGCSGTR